MCGRSSENHILCCESSNGPQFCECIQAKPMEMRVCFLLIFWRMKFDVEQQNLKVQIKLHQFNITKKIAKAPIFTFLKRTIISENHALTVIHLVNQTNLGFRPKTTFCIIAPQTLILMALLMTMKKTKKLKGDLRPLHSKTLLIPRYWT